MGMLHPVQVMGWGIHGLRRILEPLAAGRPWALRCFGGVITLIVVGSSAGLGWLLERLGLAALAVVQRSSLLPSVASRSAQGDGAAAAASLNPGTLLLGLSILVLVVSLASALAGRSLEQAVRRVLVALPADPRADLSLARHHLSWIVGRDVDQLDVPEILRASAETASENAVDGLFAPLFWMLVGILLWTIPGAPGPLSLAWAFKAASTLDSMLGYRRGSLRWLGTAGARLDDALTWLPCRLVAVTLPLVSADRGQALRLARLALRQGAADPSPNAGVSQAIYALILRLQLGGESVHAGQAREKPLVGVPPAAGSPAMSCQAVEAILHLSRRLQALWLTVPAVVVLAASITNALS